MATRVRLRAPDDDTATTVTAASVMTTSTTMDWSTTRHRDLLALDTTPARNLRPLDVLSPEFIEQRLENLKRKPTWRAYLDQYVLDHPESDDDGDDDISNNNEDAATSSSSSSNRTTSIVQPHLLHHVEIDRTALPPLARRYRTMKPSDSHADNSDDDGFVASTLWSLLVVAFTPLLVLLYPCLRHRTHWPLGCTSLIELITHAFTTLACIVASALLLYYALCREFLELRMESWHHVVVEFHALHATARVCGAAVQSRDATLAQELCAPLAVDLLLVAACVALAFQSHRRWTKYALVAVAIAFAADAPARLLRAVTPAPLITRVDPTFALVHEELVVALDGMHLQAGGTIAWVAYWGCAAAAPAVDVTSCEKQFASRFDAGVVRVTFTSLDHFVPCYKAPPNPLKQQTFVCFEHVRVRVKDKHSIPGWSLQ